MDCGPRPESGCVKFLIVCQSSNNNLILNFLPIFGTNGTFLQWTCFRPKGSPMSGQPFSAIEILCSLLESKPFLDDFPIKQVVFNIHVGVPDGTVSVCSFHLDDIRPLARSPQTRCATASKRCDVHG